MTKDELFEKIKNDSASDEEYLIKLLEFRGFLIDSVQQGYSLSDNGHVKDAAYLDELLQKYDIGQIEDNKIIIIHAENAESLFDEFKEKQQISVCACSNDLGWNFYKHVRYGRKAAVSWLEPYIARYVKAVSACGVMTVGSCDGNHPNRKYIFLQLENSCSGSWHKIICKKCLSGRFNIEWDDGYTRIYFRPDTKFDTYYEVNKAAKFLYDNRIKIREIRESSLHNLTRDYIKHHTNQEIEEEFIEQAEKLFDESGLCL